MKTLPLAVGLLALLQPHLWATAQRGEILEYQGKEIEIYTTPLEAYFDDGGHKRPEFPVASTALWRGYIGKWKIEGGKLYLVSLHREDWESLLEGGSPLGEELPLLMVSKDWESPVHATWFNKVLRIPEGDRLRYVHMGFGSTYERDRYLTIKDGNVVATKVVNNKGFGATRSTSDLEWVAMAGEPVADGGKWTDARILKGKRGKITTRGILFAGPHFNPPRLWVPITPTTERVNLELSGVPDEPVIANGSHVEIVVTFDRESGRYTVEAIRALKPGETIHHPKFRVQGRAKGKRKPGWRAAR